MMQAAEQTITVVGRAWLLEDAMEVLERDPCRSPAAFDCLGAGAPERLTPQEVIRTRKPAPEFRT